MKYRAPFIALFMAAGIAGAQPACPASGRELPVEALYGQWDARFVGMPGIARRELAKPPA